MIGRDIIRVLWGEGIRVAKRSEASLALTPSSLVTPDILELAKAHKDAIAAVVSTLPLPGYCQICGEATPRSPEISEGNCVACALIAVERILQKRKEEECQSMPA